jgi:hypothetical protein
VRYGARITKLLTPNPHEVAAAMRSAHYLQHKSNGQRMWRGVMWRAENDPFATLGEPDVLRRIAYRDPIIPRRVFCKLAGVGRSTLYVQKRRGNAPMNYRRGRRVFVPATAAAIWCAQRGRHWALEAIVDWIEAQRRQRGGLATGYSLR